MKVLKVIGISITIVIVITVVVILVLAHWQKKITEKYAELWRSKGWPVEYSEICPLKSTEEGCKEWLGMFDDIYYGETDLGRFIKISVS